jgi:hypothetical protein
MSSPEAVQLAELVRRQAEAFKAALASLTESDAGKAPEGRWSPKQIISHVLGPEEIGNMPVLKGFVEQDTPRFDLVPEDPFFSEKRAGMTLVALLKEFEQEYGRIADFTAGLTDAQLSRKAQIPMLKDSPLGEYPTLAQWIGGLADYHLGFHTDHLQEIRKALGVQP